MFSVDVNIIFLILVIYHEQQVINDGTLILHADTSTLHDSILTLQAKVPSSNAEVSACHVEVSLWNVEVLSYYEDYMHKATEAFHICEL